MEDARERDQYLSDEMAEHLKMAEAAHNAAAAVANTFQSKMHFADWSGSPDGQRLVSLRVVQAMAMGEATTPEEAYAISVEAAEEQGIEPPAESFDALDDVRSKTMVAFFTTVSGLLGGGVAW